MWIEFLLKYRGSHGGWISILQIWMKTESVEWRLCLSYYLGIDINFNILPIHIINPIPSLPHLAAYTKHISPSYSLHPSYLPIIHTIILFWLKKYAYILKRPLLALVTASFDCISLGEKLIKRNNIIFFVIMKYCASQWCVVIFFYPVFFFSYIVPKVGHERKKYYFLLVFVVLITYPHIYPCSTSRHS